jgi:hypothetical protein
MSDWKKRYIDKLSTAYLLSFSLFLFTREQMAQERTFIKIDLSDYDNRKNEITRDLMAASTEQGFFYGKCSFLHYPLKTTSIFSNMTVNSCQPWYLCPRNPHYVPDQP